MAKPVVQRALLPSRIKQAIKIRLKEEHKGLDINRMTLFWYAIAYFRFMSQACKSAAEKAVSRGSTQLSRADVQQATRITLRKYASRKVISSKVKRQRSSQRGTLNSLRGSDSP